jgi:hypothetical protein
LSGGALGLAGTAEARRRRGGEREVEREEEEKKEKKKEKKEKERETGACISRAERWSRSEGLDAAPRGRGRRDRLPAHGSIL